MKLKIYMSGKYVFVPAEFAKDFINEINNACVRAAAQEKDGKDFIPFQPLELELRAD